jgi:hypothetical protein
MSRIIGHGELSTYRRVQGQPGMVTPAQAYLRLLSAGVDLFAIRESMAACKIIDEQKSEIPCMFRVA